MTTKPTTIVRRIGSSSQYAQDSTGKWWASRSGSYGINHNIPVSETTSRALRCTMLARLARKYGKKTYIFEGREMWVSPFA